MKWHPKTIKNKILDYIHFYYQRNFAFSRDHMVYWEKE